MVTICIAIMAVAYLATILNSSLTKSKSDNPA